jgi:hypothetical protein
LKRFDCERELKFAYAVFTAIMGTNAHAAFLRRQAETLRALARRSPQLAEALRRLADQLQAMADEVDGGQGSAEP